MVGRGGIEQRGTFGRHDRNREVRAGVEAPLDLETSLVGGLVHPLDSDPGSVQLCRQPGGCRRRCATWAADLVGVDEAGGHPMEFEMKAGAARVDEKRTVVGVEERFTVRVKAHQVVPGDSPRPVTT